MFPKTIFSYITTQENSFQTEKITLGDNWRWNFKDHVQMIFHLKNGVFFKGENDWLRAFKNIMEPVLSLAYWTEDIEVKDVVFFSESKNGRVISFFFKKYHDEIYVREHDLDELFDEITESDVDYGGVLVDVTAHKRPTVISLTKIAFCDQTNMMGGPNAIKMYLSPSRLKAMEKQGWFKKENGADGSVQDLIKQANFDKDPEGGQKGDKQNETTGKNIEVYIVRGPLPENYLKEDGDEEEIVNQLQIVAFYHDKKNKRQGFTIYKKAANEDSIEFFTSQKVPDRALGRGWGEKMLSDQVWTNFLQIHKMQMLESGAKTPLVTDDETFANRQKKIQEMENNEITTIKENRTIRAIPTINVNNLQLFDNEIESLFQHAQYAGAAFDPLMGKEQSSGTTFRGQERVVAQGKGPHDRLRGKRAKFIEKLYRVRILKDIKSEILKGKKFLATLTGDEMQWVIDQLAVNAWNQYYAEKVLEGGDFAEGEQEQFIEAEKLKLKKNGNKFLLEVLKEEFDGIEISMGINVAGKQKDLGQLSDKVLSIFQFAFSNPVAFQQTLQIPGMSDAMNSILEYSNVNQSEFYGLTQKMAVQPPPEQASPVQLPDSQPVA